MPASKIIIDVAISLENFLSSERLMEFMDVRFKRYSREDIYLKIVDSFKKSYTYDDMDGFVDEYFDISMETSLPEDLESFFSAIFQFKVYIDQIKDGGDDYKFMDLSHNKDLESIRTCGGVIFRGLDVLFDGESISFHLETGAEKKQVDKLMSIFKGGKDVANQVESLNKEILKD